MTLHETARALLKDGKGIFIADEGLDSGNKLFTLHGVAESSETYQTYRALLAGTEGIEKHLSGIVLPREAFVNVTPDGTPLYDVLASKKILLGVDVQEVTGDALSNLLTELKSFGVVFALKRVARSVESGPAPDSFKESLREAIEFAKVCQPQGIVPIAHVDVLMRGMHSAAQTEDVLTDSLALFSDALESAELDLKGIIVASSMAVAGRESDVPADSREVADRTARVLASSLPEGIAGVVFVSDLQSPEEATANFNAISRMEPLRWPVAFAFSDAFESPVLAVWQGRAENVPDAQSVFLERLSLASLADAGGYSKGMEESALG